jgi:intracellular multiplication protein IcmP
MGWGILLGVFAAVFALFWYFFSDEVKSAFRWWRWTQIWLLSFFLEDGHVIQWTGADGQTYDIDFYEWLDAIPALEPRDLNAQTMSIISTLAMEPIKLPIMIIFALIAIWAVTKGPGTQYRNKYNLDGLIATMSGLFPVIRPFVKFNPANQPPRAPGTPVPSELPLFAEALGPEEWLAYNQIPIPDGKIDERACYMAYARQLGGRWRGPAHLAPHKQVLLAAFCLKAKRKRKEADDMLARLSACWSMKNGLQLSKDKNLLKEARKILKTRSIAGPTLGKCNRHAFQTTALIRALQTAREEGGVLAPAQFVWLRAHDRTLWYPLNNFGRQSFHMEAIGAMSHYKTEKRTERPIPKPKVDDAISTIVEYMASAIARPIPQLDYSKSKKKGVKKPTSAGVKKPRKTAKA